MPHDFEYDVAFSFLAQDESVATELNDALCERVKTFLYSKRQEQLAGTDGEKTFNAVFGEKSRVVVILYRDTWGTNPWTRIEETAIRNRAHEEGYDFALLVPMGKPPTTPKWFPKNRLWLGLERYGVAGAAAVIEARIQELGGTPHQETLEERAARQARAVEFKAEREMALNSRAGVEAFGHGIESLIAAIKHGVDRINAWRTYQKLEFRGSPQPRGPCFVLGLKRGLDVRGMPHYTNTLENVYLNVTLWRGVPPMQGTIQFEDPVRHLTRKYELDYLPSKNYVWKHQTDRNRSFSSEELAEEILKWYLDNGGDSSKRATFHNAAYAFSCRQGETVRNVLLVVFMAAILPAPRSIASTNLFAEIDADALNKLETAAIALDGDINESASGRSIK